MPDFDDLVLSYQNSGYDDDTAVAMAADDVDRATQAAYAAQQRRARRKPAAKISKKRWAAHPERGSNGV